jgi:hypothetical protein
MDTQNYSTFNPETVKRFWQKVQKTETCWLWTASLRNKGYGAFGYTVNGKAINGRAHRFSYELHIGSIPDGLFVLHTCDTPACVNPAHLFLGTNLDNVRDMMEKGRHLSGGTHCGSSGKWIHGTSHHRAKLNAEKVREIRQLHEDGMTNLAIGKLFNVSVGTVSNVINHISWKHIE